MLHPVCPALTDMIMQYGKICICKNLWELSSTARTPESRREGTGLRLGHQRAGGKGQGCGWGTREPEGRDRNVARLGYQRVGERDRVAAGAPESRREGTGLWHSWGTRESEGRDRVVDPDNIYKNLSVTFFFQYNSQHY